MIEFEADFCSVLKRTVIVFNMEPQPSTSDGRPSRQVDLSELVHRVMDSDSSENERTIADSDSDEDFVGKVDNPFDSSDEIWNEEDERGVPGRDRVPRQLIFLTIHKVQYRIRP